MGFRVPINHAMSETPTAKVEGLCFGVWDGGFKSKGKLRLHLEGRGP